VLSCEGLLPICSLKLAMGMKPTASGDTRNDACRQCRIQALRVGKTYDLVDVSLESLLGQSEKDMINNILVENSSAPLKLTYDGIAFGAAVLGETLRARRKLDASEFTAEDRDLIKSLLFSCLTIHFALKILFARYAIKRIVFFGDYAYWISAQLLARQHNIGTTHITHAYNLDIDRRLIEMRPGSVNAHILHQIAHWRDYQDRPIEAASIAKIATSALYRLSGHGGASTYSPNWVRRDKGLQTELGLSAERKTIVAYTASSDEFVAISQIMNALGKPYAQGRKPFADQKSWLRDLVDWVGTRDDLQLIVRFHPRIGVGHRHASHASEYFQFKKEFASHPANVAMIWPEDTISSYNLAEIADAAVTSWSTIGLELARFGIPVIAAFPNVGIYPVGGFAAFAPSASEYFALLDSALDRPASLDLITEAFRWTYFVFGSPIIDVSDLIPTPDYGGIPRWRMPKNEKEIVRALIEGEDVSTATMARLPGGVVTAASEHRAMLETIDRFILFFMSGADRNGLRPQDLRPQADGMVGLELDGRTVQRYSPLVHRLATLLGQPAAGHTMIHVA